MLTGMAQGAYEHRLERWRKRANGCAWATVMGALGSAWADDLRWWAATGGLAVVTAACALCLRVLAARRVRERIVTRSAERLRRLFLGIDPP
jgi:hypothetical protein